MRVKVCGITRARDAVAVAEAGADAIGLVFWPDSPRAVDEAEAREILAALPPFVTSVALFVDAGEQRVREVLAAVPVDLVQFHGHESAAQCEACGRPYLRAVRVRGRGDIEHAASEFSGARGLLLDAWNARLPGGAGEAFDWNLVPDAVAQPVVLAGGLNPGNVAGAVARVRPWGVDVSSGVEQRPGIKDARQVARFVSEVQRGAGNQYQSG